MQSDVSGTVLKQTVGCWFGWFHGVKQYFSFIVAVSLSVEETRVPIENHHKSLTNFITKTLSEIWI
jgi:hypothetical protein